MERLVECVPNFSEGRNPETVQRLIAAATAVAGVYLLDQEMDHDHHRSVLTFAGDPEAVVEAAFRCARTASELIDLRTHQGAHPRVGATDVIPFVPIRGVTMDDCVALARQVGRRIGHDLHIPVFLYERAATHPDRTNLEAIRRGGLEGLKARMAAEPTWRPDFGPPALHPTAGATIVGARPPLIAFNVNLRSTEVAAAKAIAKTVRFSSGGLRSVKAIGVALASRGLVQVSMNLTNFEETPIHVAFEAVAHEAAQRGMAVVESEIVGLVPQRALVQAAEHLLKLSGFDVSQVLETRLEQALTRITAREAPAPSPTDALATSVTSFLTAVSQGTPTPGGGSVAALAGALAASLGLMACRLGPPKRRPDEVTGSEEATSHLHAAEHTLVRLATRLQTLIQTDAEAYQEVLEGYRMPRSDARREAVITEKLIGASQVPLETAELAHEAAMLLLDIRRWAKASVESDLRVGLFMAIAAIEGGLENARQNIKSLQNQSLADDIPRRIEKLEQSLVQLKALC